jgi:hypothetical protein
MIAFTYKRLGKEPKSKNILNTIRTSLENTLRNDQSFSILRVLALFHAVQNEKEESLKYLSELVKMGQGTTWFDLVECNPLFKNLWDDPDFKAIIKKNKEKLEKIQAKINEMREQGEISI